MDIILIFDLICFLIPVIAAIIGVIFTVIYALIAYSKNKKKPLD